MKASNERVEVVYDTHIPRTTILRKARHRYSGTPWLSILVPVYNVEPYLKECLESVLSQADDGVEILLLDDGSTDGSLSLLEGVFDASNGRFTILSHDHNRGLSAARNSMLEKACGRYLWFLDSDDALAPGAVTQLKQIVQQHKPDLVLSDFVKIRMHGNPQRISVSRPLATFTGPSRRKFHNHSTLLFGLLVQRRMYMWANVSRRELWSDLHFPEGKYFEDQFVVPTLALTAKSFFYAKATWVKYRKRPGSIMATPSEEKYADAIQSLTKCIEILHRAGLASTDLKLASTFALVQFCITNSKKLERLGEASRNRMLSEWRHLVDTALPLELNDLRWEYLKRLWLLRWLRLELWLRDTNALSPTYRASGTAAIRESRGSY